MKLAKTVAVCVASLIATSGQAGFVASFHNTRSPVYQGEVWNPNSQTYWELENQFSNDPLITRTGLFTVSFLNGSPSSVQVSARTYRFGLAAVTGTISTEIKFLRKGPDQVSMTIPYTTSSGSTGTASAAIGIEILNAAPSITQIQGDQFVNAGQQFQYFASATDPGEDPLTYKWDLDGNGIYDDATGRSGSTSFAQTGNYNVGVQVFDDWDVPLSVKKSFTVHVYPAGDFNRNGIVDARDFAIWRKTDGTSAGYAKWRTDFGKSVALASGGSVPEPTTYQLVIVLGSLLSGVAHRRRLKR